MQINHLSRPVGSAGGVGRQSAEMGDDAKTILADENPADVKLPCGMGSTVFLLVEVWFFLNGFNKNINHRNRGQYNEQCVRDLRQAPSRGRPYHVSWFGEEERRHRSARCEKHEAHVQAEHSGRSRLCQRIRREDESLHRLHPVKQDCEGLILKGNSRQHAGKPCVAGGGQNAIGIVMADMHEKRTQTSLCARFLL